MLTPARLVDFPLCTPEPVFSQKREHLVGPLLRLAVSITQGSLLSKRVLGQERPRLRTSHKHICFICIKHGWFSSEFGLGEDAGDGDITDPTGRAAEEARGQASTHQASFPPCHAACWSGLGFCLSSLAGGWLSPLGKMAPAGQLRSLHLDPQLRNPREGSDQWAWDLGPPRGDARMPGWPL